MALFNKNTAEHLKLNSYQLECLSKFRKLELKPPPIPWTKYKYINGSGIIAAGWISSHRIILISDNRYSVFDINSNEAVELVLHESINDLFSTDHLSFRVEGNDQEVKVFGIYGGSGNKFTSDSWMLDVIYPAWPNACVVLRSPKLPGKDIYPWEGVHLIKLNALDYSELIVGFSPDEQSFLILGNCGCEVYSRM